MYADNLQCLNGSSPSFTILRSSPCRMQAEAEFYGPFETTVSTAITVLLHDSRQWVSGSWVMGQMG